MTKKRLDLFKYNVKYRLQRGQMYDMRQDLDSFNQTRSINVINFSNKKELYLLDEKSDATEFGGQTQTDL